MQLINFFTKFLGFNFSIIRVRLFMALPSTINAISEKGNLLTIDPWLFYIQARTSRFPKNEMDERFFSELETKIKELEERYLNKICDTSSEISGFDKALISEREFTYLIELKLKQAMCYQFGIGVTANSVTAKLYYERIVSEISSTTSTYHSFVLICLASGTDNTPYFGSFANAIPPRFPKAVNFYNMLYRDASSEQLSMFEKTLQDFRKSENCSGEFQVYTDFLLCALKLCFGDVEEAKKIIMQYLGNLEKIECSELRTLTRDMIAKTFILEKKYEDAEKILQDETPDSPESLYMKAVLGLFLRDNDGGLLVAARKLGYPFTQSVVVFQDTIKKQQQMFKECLKSILPPRKKLEAILSLMQQFDLLSKSKEAQRDVLNLLIDLFAIEISNFDPPCGDPVRWIIIGSSFERAATSSMSSYPKPILELLSSTASSRVEWILSLLNTFNIKSPQHEIFQYLVFIADNHISFNKFPTDARFAYNVARGCEKLQLFDSEYVFDKYYVACTVLYDNGGLSALANTFKSAEGLKTFWGPSKALRQAATLAVIIVRDLLPRMMAVDYVLNGADKQYLQSLYVTKFDFVLPKIQSEIQQKSLPPCAWERFYEFFNSSVKVDKPTQSSRLEMGPWCS